MGPQEMLFMGVLGVAFLFMLIGTIGFIITSFSESFGWGLACMFIPFAWIVFIIKIGRGGGYATLVIIAYLLYLGVIFMSGGFENF